MASKPVKVFKDSQFLVVKVEGQSLFGPRYMLYFKKKFLFFSRYTLVKQSLSLDTIESTINLLRASSDNMGLTDNESRWASKMQLGGE